MFDEPALAGSAEGYRPDIDGLRAVAVMAVMLYHAGVAVVPGGMLGVDVFFVISGYLITGILWNGEGPLGRRLADFYLRRIRRIVPAATLVVAATLVLGLILLTPHDLEQVAGSALAALGFAANLYFWQEPGGYFAPDADLQPLIHYWSLGVEEQFYLLYPLVLLGLLRVSPRLAAMALALGLALSLALAQWALDIYPAAAFYLLPSRAWELLAGALAYVASRSHWSVQLPAGARQAIAWIALAIVFGAMVMEPEQEQIPGLALLPLIGATAVLLVTASAASGAGRLLACRPLVFIGLISFSLYLWHQPLLALARSMSTAPLNGIQALPWLALAGALAWLTWRWVEQPYRHRASTCQVLLHCLLAVALVVLAAVAIKATGGAAMRFDASAMATADRARERSPYRVCMFQGGRWHSEPGTCTFPSSDGPPRVVAIGDSHAMALFPAVADAAALDGKGAVLLAAAGCYPVAADRLASAKERECAIFQAEAMRWIDQAETIETVVISYRWTNLWGLPRFDNGLGGVERAGGQGMIALSPAARARRIDALRAFVAWAGGSGRRVVVVYPVPEMGWDVPDFFLHQNRFGPISQRAVPLGTYRHRTAAIEAELDRLVASEGAVRVRPASRLCSEDGGCGYQRGGALLYSDDDHLTPDGARVALPRESLRAGWSELRRR